MVRAGPDLTVPQTFTAICTVHDVDADTVLLWRPSAEERLGGIKYRDRKTYERSSRLRMPITC